MIEDVTKQAKDDMDKIVESLKRALSTVPSGKASPAMFEGLRVSLYGSEMPLKQVAALSSVDARTIAIQPFDNATMAQIEKAIVEAKLGVTLTKEGVQIRITVLPLTHERRKELIKQTLKHHEESKVLLRNVRREANDTLKEMEKDRDISEDMLKRGIDDVQKLTDEYIRKLDMLSEQKEKDIMSI